MSHSPGSVDGLPLFGPLTRIEARLIRMGLTVEFKHSRFVFLEIGDEDIDEDEAMEEEIREHIRQREEDANESEAEEREQEKEENSNLRMARVNSREKARESHSEEEQHAGELQLALMEENLPLPNCSYLPASDELRIFREAASPQQYGTRLAKELFFKPGMSHRAEFHYCDELMKKFLREAVNTRFPTPDQDTYRQKWSRTSAAITRLFRQHNRADVRMQKKKWAASTANVRMQKKKSLSLTPAADTPPKLMTRSSSGILKNKLRFSPSPAQKPDVSNSSNTMVARGTLQIMNVPGPVTRSALTRPTRTSGKRPLSSTPRAPPKKALPATPPKKAPPAPPPKKAPPALLPKKALPANPQKALPAPPTKNALPAPPKNALPAPPPKKAPPARISSMARGAKRQSRGKKGKPPPWSCARIRPFNRESFLDFSGNSSSLTTVTSAASSKGQKKKKLSTTPRSRPASSPQKSKATRKRFRFSTPTGNKSSNTRTSAARPVKQAKKGVAANRGSVSSKDTNMNSTDDENDVPAKREHLGGSPWLDAMERDPGGMPLTRSHTSSARPNYCSPFPKPAKTSTADFDMKSAKKARTRTSEPFNPNFPNRH